MASEGQRRSSASAAEKCSVTWAFGTSTQVTAAEGVGFEPTVPKGHSGFRDLPKRLASATNALLRDHFHRGSCSHAIRTPPRR